MDQNHNIPLQWLRNEFAAGVPNWKALVNDLVRDDAWKRPVSNCASKACRRLNSNTTVIGTA